ncbi:MAG: FAD-linked oxidase C-terminal domain-containing protein, partial [Myxococcota bacterium]
LGRQSLKGVAGYDLTSLLVGSEGTLALIAGITVHLIPAPEAVETAWLTFPDMAKANDTAARMFAAGIVPSTLEVMDRLALDVVRPAAPFRIPVGAGAAILAETDGPASQAREALLRLAEIAVEAGATDTAVASSDKQREAMRRTRRLVSSTLKEKMPHKISDDIAVPRSRMAEALERAQALGDEMGIEVSAYGHLGDGNLHVNLLCRSAEEQAQGEVLRRRITAVIVGMGGTITGEHGIGLAKRDLLPIEQAPSVIALQQRLKSVFDPQGILNPGKVFSSLAPPFATQGAHA